MEKEILYGKVHMTEAEDTILEYYMIVEEISEEFSKLKSYGAKINKTTRRPGKRKTAEMKQINGIFYHRADAERFLECIMRNTVTPVTLSDVTEDYIVEMLEKVMEEKKAAV